jgi:hypothetical protein
MGQVALHDHGPPAKSRSSKGEDSNLKTGLKATDSRMKVRQIRRTIRIRPISRNEPSSSPRKNDLHWNKAQ